MYRRQPKEKRRSPKQASRSLLVGALVLVLINLVQDNETAIAQSIGYQPTLNFGFNPHLSPVFGYGLGLPYGAYNFSPLQNPLLAGSLLMNAGAGHHENSFLGKIHAKSFLKKFAYSPFYPGYYYPGGYKSKLALMKHPELAYTPYGADYGFGKHYGSALVPNNPYKSTYGEYYTNSATGTGAASNSSPLVAESSTSTSTAQVPSGDIYFNSHHHQQQPFNEQTSFAQYGHHNYDDQGYAMDQKKALIKPLIKAGVLLTTAAVLGKKSLEHGFPGSSMKLNPVGMIGNIRGDN